MILVNSLFAVDHLIIAPAEFIPQANQIADFYQNHFGIERNIIDQQDIFNQFGESLEGIKEYIQSCFPDPETWSENSVLLIGSGTNLWELDIDKNRIMVYDTGNYVTDDGFVNLDDDPYPEIPIGRIPAQNVEQLELYTERMFQYIEEPTLGWWRDKMLILADDEHKSGHLEGTGGATGLNHTWQAQETGEVISNAVYVDKVLGIEYEFDQYGFKPDATDDLLDKLNEGRFIWHYIGHGCEFVLGDENYFKTAEHLSLLNNPENLFLFTTASGDVGHYSDPEYDCMAEQLLFYENGGSIASISATGSCGGNDNNTLFRSFFVNIINERMNLGTALLDAKLNSGASYSNSRLYNILGDPLMFINPPESDSSITITGNPDTLFAGDFVEFSVQSGNGITSGTAHTLIYESEYDIHYENSLNEQFYEVDYTKNGYFFYFGVTFFDEGEFQAGFTVPEDINFGDRGRILSYHFNNGQNKDFVSYYYPLSFAEPTQVDPGDIELDVISISTYPNPFQSNTKISYYLPDQTNVELSVYNI
ncbi:MAG TPA: hypothetical protein ENL20_02955, partial [Candidatus Cloacimonetes bacterium]|nr:hypothetical protein [Candidatus Cloacimonadota bacterium]